MRRYNLGDADAFNELHRRHAPKIYGYLTRKLKTISAADDVFQDTFLRLHKFRSRYDPALPFVPWFFTIARNAIIDHHRKQQTLVKNESEEVEETTAIWNPTTTQAAPFYTYLDGLSEREKEVLTLHINEGFSFREISSWLKMSPSNARKLSSRAIQKLKAMWK